MPTLVLVTLNETRKGLLITWSYKFNNVAEFVGIGFWFVGIALLMGSGELESARLPSMLLGFLTWYYAAIAIGNMSFGLSEETTTGTLEQMYLSPNPPKDTDGRREGSGRGWVRELQGRWPGVLG